MSGPIRIATSEAHQTKALARAIAGLAEPGDLLVLAGEMGAGKTAFAQGFGVGLGITEPITSPTFTIVREYPGRLALHHIDAYRLEHLQEVAELGVAEMLDEAAVMLVEWGDAILPVLPPDYLEVRLEFGKRDDDREIQLTAVGVRWVARLRLLADVVSRWAADADSAERFAGDEPC